MNLFYHSSVAGLIGAFIVNALTYLYRWAGLKVSLPWEIAASVFLNGALIYTPVGIFLGLVGTVALSIATALCIAYILRYTGLNDAWLKGILTSNALGFINIGLFMRLLGIWPQLRNEPFSNLAALINLSALGLVQGLLLKHWWLKRPAS